MSFISGFIPSSLKNYGPTHTQPHIPAETPVLSLLENALTSKVVVAFLVTVTAIGCIAQAGAIGLATSTIAGFTAGMILWHYYPEVKAAAMIISAAVSAYFATKAAAETADAARNFVGAAAPLAAEIPLNPIPRGLNPAPPPSPTPNMEAALEASHPLALAKQNAAITIALRDTAIYPGAFTALRLMSPNRITEVFCAQYSRRIPGALAHLTPNMVRNMFSNHAPGAISGRSSHVSSILNSIVMASKRPTGLHPGALTQLKPGAASKISSFSSKAGIASLGIIATTVTAYVVYKAYQNSQAKSLTHTVEDGQEQQSNITKTIVALSQVFPKATKAFLSDTQGSSEGHVIYTFDTSNESVSPVKIQKLESFTRAPFRSYYGYGFLPGTATYTSSANNFDIFNKFEQVKPSEVLKELPELTELPELPANTQPQEHSILGFGAVSPSDL